MPGIYVISTPSQAKENLYKVGFHSGSLTKLQSRYRTSMHNHQIYYFARVSVGNQIERDIKTLLNKARQRNDAGRLSEWFQISLSELIIEISQLVIKYLQSDLSNSEISHPEESEISSDRVESEVSDRVESEINSDRVESKVNDFVDIKDGDRQILIPQRSILTGNKTEIGAGEWWKALIRQCLGPNEPVDIRLLKKSKVNEESDAEFALRVSGSKSTNTNVNNYTIILKKYGLIQSDKHSFWKLKPQKVTSPELLTFLGKMGIVNEFKESMYLDYFFGETSGFKVTFDNCVYYYSAQRVE